MRRLLPRLLACAAAALAAHAVPAPAAGDEREAEASSVAAANGVVVHGVDQTLLAARIREVDQRLVAGEFDTAAAELADLTTSDLSALLEEGEGIYLGALEGVLQRAAKLPPAGLAAYRRVLDARAEAALASAAARRDAQALAREASRFAFTTAGPRLLLLLGDLRLAQGDLGGAERALEDLLRLLPGHADAATLAAGASRLAAILAARGDAPAVRGLAADLAAPVLDAPSPLVPGSRLRDDLARAAAVAERRSSAPEVPDAPLRVVAELQFNPERREGGAGAAGRDPGTLEEQPIPVGTPERPALLIRAQNATRTQARVLAIAPVAPEPGAADAGRPAPFRPLWLWPSSVSEEVRRATDYPFEPVRLTDDLVLFTWPVPPSEEARRGDLFAERGDERHQLVVLSLSAEGKLVEERGRDESDREDADAELEGLSFCGAPAVDGRAVYVTAVRNAPPLGDATELHLCRFDFVPDGRGGRLRLRWRRHVLDGRPIPPAVFRVREVDATSLGVTLPSSPLVRAGRVFVASNTGAVACLDAASGRPEWVETYERFGPSARTTVRETELVTWGNVPLRADGPWIFAAPRDADTLLQLRRAPRGARSARVEDFAFAGPNGTARTAGCLLPDLVPTDVAGVRDGVVYLSGRVARRPVGGMSVDGSPLVAFRLDERRALVAQVQELASAGPPVMVRDALLFPTAKAIYRVPLRDFESAPAQLWRNAGGGDPWRSADRVGVLVPDGARLWSFTPTRVLLLEPVR